MVLKFEQNKWYLARNGQKVRILCTDWKDEYQPIIALMSSVDGCGEFVMFYRPDGHVSDFGGPHMYDLVSEYKEPEYRWVNINKNPFGKAWVGGGYSSRQAADEGSINDRIGCIKVKVEEGRFDE